MALFTSNTEEPSSFMNPLVGLYQKSLGKDKLKALQSLLQDI